MTAKDYKVTFGYHQKLGSYLHRGEDRSMPTGTPIVIAGTTIGLSGNTGLSTGPHLHLQAGTDIATQNTVKPTQYWFQPGTVVRTRSTDSGDWGKYVTIRTNSGMYTTYAHLSRVDVKVGQVIKEDTGMKIGTTPNWRWRMNRLHHQLVGNWNMGDSTWKAIQGKDAWEVVEDWSSHPNSNQLIEDQRLGEKARKDNWRGQIVGLREEVANLSTRPTKAELDAVKKKAEELAAQVEKAEKEKSEDTILLDETGNWLTKLFNRLFKKG